MENTQPTNQEASVPAVTSDPARLNEAIDLYSTDWDAGGTVSVYLPTHVAKALLFARGWELQTRTIPSGRHRGREISKWVAPGGEIQYWDTQEALQVALASEVC